jgi:hypothetical protein
VLVLPFGLAASIHRLLRTYAPTNILVRHLQPPCGPKRAIAASVALVPTYNSEPAATGRIWNTRNPSCGMDTPSFKVTVGTSLIV